jgi:hypothetical protein
MSIRYISTISNLRPSEIYPNLDFWSENKLSGHPDVGCSMFFSFPVLVGKKLRLLCLLLHAVGYQYRKNKFFATTT